jgi:hypothetical protein
MRTTQHRSVTITMKTTPTLAALLVGILVGNYGVIAFQQGPVPSTSINIVRHGKQFDSAFAAPSLMRQPFHHQQQQQQSHTTSTSLYLIDPTSLGATIIALASAAAAWQEYRTDKFQAYKEATGRSLFKDDDGKDTNVKVLASATAVEEKTADATPTSAPKKSFVSKLNPLKAKKDASPAPTPVKRVEPVNVSKSATAPEAAAPKPLTLEVGNTIEKNREMNELGEKRRKEDEEKAAAAAVKKAEQEKKETESQKVAAKAAAAAATTKKGGFIRTTLRVIKKVIAPWRKWENIA